MLFERDGLESAAFCFVSAQDVHPLRNSVELKFNVRGFRGFAGDAAPPAPSKPWNP